jgi:hypothetical protein
MTNTLLYAAESWDKVYKAFEQINFTAYDFDAVKQSLLDYLKLNYPENFNDYIDSSELVAIIDLFAYVAEQHAYRVDMAAHENMLPTARRKQNILRLANLVSYSASRNLPLRGFVKLTSVACSENLVDSQGNSLTNKVVKWADPNNPLWREQFQLVMNRLLATQLGAPFKSTQVDDMIIQQYELLNLLEAEADGTSFENGTLPLSVNVNGQELKFELVPADVDDSGVFERSPDPNQHFSLVYSDDGYGDSSDMTGFLMYLKQGVLQKLPYTFTDLQPNRVIDVDLPNINDVDVWLHEVDTAGNILYEWEQVDAVNGSNLAFNTISNQKKFEVETRERDQIRLVFGSGDYAAIPLGSFNIWTRTSTSGSLTVSKTDIVDSSTTFVYNSKQGRRETCTLTFSLTAALQNSADSEDFEHIKQAAPGNFYTQDRMVNGQDYNNFLLQDPSILKLKAVNRTFAGQPKYIEWNDASTKYQNIKLFGDDGRIFFDIGAEATSYKVSARTFIDQVLEPALSEPGIYNLISYAFSQSSFPLSDAYIRPRVSFIEDYSLGLQEKTVIQGALDRHWYGEPERLVYLGPDLTETTPPQSVFGVVNADSDKRVYDSALKLVTYASSAYSLAPWPGAVSSVQNFVSRQRRFGVKFVPDRPFASALVINPANAVNVTSTDFLTAANISQSGLEDVYTIEIIDADVGTFSVYSKKRGLQPSGVVGEAYSNGYISFVLGIPNGQSTTLVVGDAFIIKLERDSFTVMMPTIYKKNLLGKFELINEASLSANAEALPYDVSDSVKSWIMIVERVDAADGSLDSWRLTRRNYKLALESPTSKFWFSPGTYLVDPETKKRVFDTVKLLKSNMTADGTAALGVDQKYMTVGSFINADGSTNDSALLLTPTVLDEAAVAADGRPYASFLFLDFVADNSYVYFTADSVTGKLTPAPKTAYLQSLTYVNDTAGSIVRKRGREALDFVWIHYAAQESLIDPAPSNIIDMFVLTRGYYSRLVDYVRGTSTVEPVPPTPFELRATYRGLLTNKMISDTTILHPAKVKLLFGSKALPELRAKVKLVKTASSRLANDQLRLKVLDIVNNFFSIDNLDFSSSFYATSLISVIHKELPLDVAAAVLVPEFPTNYYGDLQQISAGEDEVLVSALELKDVVVVEGLDRATLRQK